MINDINGISETLMEFKTDLYLRVYWRDQRLHFPLRSNLSHITLESGFAKKLWIPDVFFLTTLDVTPHNTIESNSVTNLRLYHNGVIHYSKRLILHGRCPMDLTYFPLDQQKCSIRISTYGHELSELQYHWLPDPKMAIEISARLHKKMATFHLQGVKHFHTTNNISTGVFSVVQCDIYLTRSIMFYISQVYAPSFLIVIISWVPFWLAPDDHHARVALGVTTVLTMTTLVTNVQADFPKISHLKAIDVYLFVCFFMVFLSLLEYATAGYVEYKYRKVWRRQRGDQYHQGHRYGYYYRDGQPDTIGYYNKRYGKRRGGGDCNNNNCRSSLSSSSASPSSLQQPPPSSTLNTLTIDQWSRRVFPITFIVFNLIYSFTLYAMVKLHNEPPPIKMDV